MTQVGDGRQKKWALVFKAAAAAGDTPGTATLVPRRLPMARLVLLVFLALGAGWAGAQPLPSLAEGAPLRGQRWTWRDYNANHQNWETVQGPDGRIYVANSEGVLEYDGEEWRLHSLPVQERAMVRSLAVGMGGAVFVGGVGDFGALLPGAAGTTEYRSLRGHVAREEREFQDVWTTHATRRGVVFQTTGRLFRWNGTRMESWSTPTRFRSAFLVGGVVHVWEEDIGIKRLDDGLRLVDGGGWFADQKVDALVPHPAGLLAVVRDVGLVRLSRGEVRPVEGPASAYLRRYRPYTAVALPNRYGGRGPLYAVGTIGGGVAVVTPEGRLVRVYREDVGLGEADQVLGLHADQQGGLWAALLNGIVRIDLFSRLTGFGEASGLPGSVYTVAEASGTLYAGTSLGLYRLVPGRLGRPGAGSSYARFERVEAVPNVQTWALEPTQRGLLVGTNEGVFAVEEGGAREVSSALVFSLLRPTTRPDRIFVGSKEGVVVLDQRGGRWTEAGLLDGVEGEVRFIAEDASGAVWMAGLGGSLFHVSGLEGDAPTVREYSADALGLGAGPLVVIGEDVLMATREGVFRLSHEARRVRAAPVPGLGELGGVFGLFPDGPDGSDVWLSRDGTFRPLADRQVGAPFELRGVQVLSFSRTAGGVAWVGTADGLLRYDPRVAEGARRYPAFVRRVTDGQREALWGGAHAAGVGGPTLRLTYTDKSELRFEAAAAFFDAPDRTEYQFRLDGFNDTWGAWGPERVASYTSLWEGDYTLRVRARDAYGRLSEEATFAFVVLPPWYRTWWAYSLYVLTGLALVWGVSAWRLHEHRKRLDAQRARSARLQRLSNRLERLNVRLRAADKLKDDLLANTSHELRTPLTSILGFSEMLLDEVSEEVRDLAEGVQRGGRRLLSTVNGLLDMYKLQSGTLEVEAAPVDAAACVRESVGQLRPLAQARGLDLDVVAADRPWPALLDVGLLDRVVTNLVSNAIKFTDHGRVLVHVDGDDETLRIAVRDTGVGIAPDDVDRMFEPFEQASTGFGRTHEGTGLGLAIVKRIVEQVGGQVTVESEPGVGTTMTVVVPRHWGAHPAGPSGASARPSLEGAHVLSLGLDRASEGALREWVDAEGVVCAVDSLGKALREARKGSYDVAFIAADGAAEAKRTRALRAVPGYREAPLVRVGGTPLEPEELQARGFTHQAATPLGPDAAAFVEGLLVHVEAAAPAEG